MHPEKGNKADEKAGRNVLRGAAKESGLGQFGEEEAEG